MFECSPGSVHGVPRERAVHHGGPCLRPHVLPGGFGLHHPGQDARAWNAQVQQVRGVKFSNIFRFNTIVFKINV